METDQRGAGRIADSLDPDSLAVVDIGAYEFHQTLEDIPNKITNEDTPLTVTFALGDNGPGVTSVTASSNNQVVVPNANLVLSGAGTTRNLLITPVANQSGLATITITLVQVTARDDEGRTYDLLVEALNPMATIADVTQVVVRLPDNVIGAPRDLRVTVKLRGPSTNDAVIKIAAP